MQDNFKKSDEIKVILKGSTIIDVTTDTFFSSIRSLTVEKDSKLYLLSVEANMGYENTPQADIEITDVATQERIY